VYLKRYFHCNDSSHKIQTVLTISAYEQRHYSPKGVKDHSLHSAARRLCSAGGIIYWHQLSSAHTYTAPGRRTAVDVRSSDGFFFLAYHTRRSSASAAVAAMICALHVSFMSLLDGHCYLYRFFSNAFIPLILDMLIEAYLCNLELWVLLLQVYTSLLLFNAIYLRWLYARSYNTGILFNSVLWRYALCLICSRHMA